MKIFFLFMIYDIIEKEDLWYEFFKDADTTKYNIIIHAKDNSKVKFSNDFFTKFLHHTNYPTEWGTFSLVYMQNRLLKESLKDDQNYKFVLTSGTHIPLHSFNFIYNFLTSNDKSYFHYFNINKESGLFERINSINNFKNYILNSWVYASQWAIINRKQVEFIIKNEKEFNEIFEKSKFPDEYAYINYLIENRQAQKIVNLKTTYFSFVPSYNSKYRAIPHTFDLDELDKNILYSIKKSYLFMRKVVNSTIINPEWIFYDISNFKLNNNNIKLKERQKISEKVINKNHIGIKIKKIKIKVI